jgi:hypothetical protein
MSFTIELDYEMVDKIVLKQLQDTRQCYLEDLESIKNGISRHIFVFGDDEADVAEIQKHIDALDLLIEHYWIPE